MGVRTAVVTGGSRGMGAAVVARLRVEGVRAIAVARSAAGEGAVAADITQPDAVEAIREALKGRAPDILVNGAGTSYVRALEERPTTSGGRCTSYTWSRRCG